MYNRKHEKASNHMVSVFLNTRVERGPEEKKDGRGKACLPGFYTLFTDMTQPSPDKEMWGV